MKICLAQIESDRGNIEVNIENHIKWIEKSVSKEVDLVVFPELSLTGYEPKLAKQLATDQNDPRLDIFQMVSDKNDITVGVGLPIKTANGILISMILFYPLKPRKIYSKQKLHSDEEAYFIEGNEQLIIKIEDIKIAPAICYESLQLEHSENANRLGAEIYLASVAKSENGIEKAFAHFPKIAEKYSMPILMVNGVGHCDDFECAGQSAIWSKKGDLLGQLGSRSEGLLIFDTELMNAHIVERTDDPNF